MHEESVQRRGNQALSVVFSDRSWDRGHKLKYRKLPLSIITVSVTEYWHRLPKGSGEVSLLGDIQRVSGHGGEQLALGNCLSRRSWTRWPPEIHSNLNSSAILYANRFFVSLFLFLCLWMCYFPLESLASVFRFGVTEGKLAYLFI